MSPEEINAKIAKLTGANNLWLVKKRGLYYRPHSAGYTGNIAEAGRYSTEEARRHEYKRPWASPEWVTIEPAPPLDYFGSLDAMHKAIQGLTYEQAERFDIELLEICRHENKGQDNPLPLRFAVSNATPPQRAQALIAMFENGGGAP